MDGKYTPYNWSASATRISEILDQPAGQFQETKSLPARDKLTYTNGFYSYCTALFIDIRDSSSLPDRHTRPVLAKLYRAFISEMVAVLNSNPNVREVNIVGDCVWAVFNTPNRSDIDAAFSTAATANTLLKLLNLRYQKRKFSTLKIGIGLDYGRALMIKAGYNGSGINEVIYMGDVVNRAAHLAHEAGRGAFHPSPAIWIGDVLQGNLNDANKALLTSRYHNELGTVHTGDFVNTAMNEWVTENG
ncbi:adenylate/guanylate cyclase domain-containing protein [Rhodococcus qingshengii]|uniref:adenylate/guanylate cyclase domain-containing protein n=1 Tax=Rhodococcus qingshengii TaxID=334542 RepID=UPI0037C6FBF9